MRTFAYLLLLLFAFGVGLFGTVAASQALAPPSPAPAVRAVGNETQLPQRLPPADSDLFTVEC